jgi:1,2-phenylacetyl-CoA epoxidase PaaB subunit
VDSLEIKWAHHVQASLSDHSATTAIAFERASYSRHHNWSSLWICHDFHVKKPFQNEKEHLKTNYPNPLTLLCGTCDDV